jgi:hypothetical protein
VCVSVYGRSVTCLGVALLQVLRRRDVALSSLKPTFQRSLLPSSSGPCNIMRSVFLAAAQDDVARARAGLGSASNAGDETEHFGFSRAILFPQRKTCP